MVIMIQICETEENFLSITDIMKTYLKLKISSFVKKKKNVCV